MKIIREGNVTVKVYEGEWAAIRFLPVVHYHNGKRIRENFRKLTQQRVELTKSRLALNEAGDKTARRTRPNPRASRSRCQRHRKHESQRHVNGCDAPRIRLRC
jgi:hypothetical protein